MFISVDVGFGQSYLFQSAGLLVIFAALSLSSRLQAERYFRGDVVRAAGVARRARASLLACRMPFKEKKHNTIV